MPSMCGPVWEEKGKFYAPSFLYIYTHNKNVCHVLTLAAHILQLRPKDLQLYKLRSNCDWK